MRFDRLRWLIYRLRTMGSSEIASRLVDATRHLALSMALTRLDCSPQMLSERNDKLLLLSNALNNRLGQVLPEVRHRIVPLADQWLHQHGTFFDLCDYPLGDPIQWHRDYASGVVGPLHYSAFINHRDTSVVGDVKYVWELNRLQSFIILALAALWTGHDIYKTEIERQSLSWCDQNPFMRGINWKSPLEAGIRLISWAFVTVLIDDANQTLCHKALGKTIYQHQYFIRKFYSKHSSANNHLIGEMAGLYVASVIWPWYRESQAWRVFAKQKLIEAMMAQVEADGVGKEQATEYQLFILEFFLLAAALGHAIGDRFPEVFWERLRSMLMFLSSISDRSGNLPIFGDGDSGQVVWLPDTIQERTRTLVRLGQHCNSQFLHETLAGVRALLLLWGQSPEELPLTLPAEARENVHAFTASGRYVLVTNRGHEDEMMAQFDVGTFGLAPLYAHGHADALSFWLSYGGYEFLIDPGTYCYYTKNEWRSYLRGTAAHNTIRIDGVDQSVAGGHFLWRSVAHGQVTHVADTDEAVEVAGYHNGYERLSDPVIHRRCLRLCKKRRMLVVTDQLECNGTHEVELCLHFSDKCDVQCVDAHTLVASQGHKRLRIHLDPQLQPDLYRGSENPIFGWVSHSFGIKEPAFTCVARTTIARTTQFLSQFSAM